MELAAPLLIKPLTACQGWEREMLSKACRLRAGEL